MDLETFLVDLYVQVDEWWERAHTPAPMRSGRPPSLSPSEVLALAVPAQWPRFRSQRDFFRFADAHLRSYFANLLSQNQLNRRIRALEPELRALQKDLASLLADGSDAPTPPSSSRHARSQRRPRDSGLSVWAEGRPWPAPPVKWA